MSSHAISAVRARVAALGLDRVMTLCEPDLNLPMPFATRSFDAALSLDVILHLRDRLSTFREVSRLLPVPVTGVAHRGGRFLFTDAAVVTGAISDEEIRSRAIHGHTQFAPPEFNEEMLQLASLHVIDRQDRTSSLLLAAAGRLKARLGHRDELEQLDGSLYFERQLRYLGTLIELSRRGALSRIMYVTERPG